MTGARTLAPGRRGKATVDDRPAATTALVTRQRVGGRESLVRKGSLTTLS